MSEESINCYGQKENEIGLDSENYNNQFVFNEAN